MQVQLMLAVICFLCSVGKAQMLFRKQPTNKTVPSTIKASNETQLKTRMQAIQNHFLNKTVDLREVQQYASAIHRNYTQQLQKSIELFQKIFGPHLQRRNERNRLKKVKKCTVRYKERKMGRQMFPRRVKIGVCGGSPCSSSDVTCSCKASKIAFKHIIVKLCQRKRGPKRHKFKTGGRRKKPRQGRRCTWRNDVMLSAVACECRCQKH